MTEINRRKALKLSGMAIAGLAGCAGSESENPNTQPGTTQGTSTTQTGEQQYDIGFLSASQKDAWFRCEALAGKWYANSRDSISLQVTDAQYSATDQITQARNLIQQGIDALVIEALDPEALGSVVSDALDQGIPSFSVNSAVSSGETKMHTAFGNYQAGARAAENAIKRIQDKKGEASGQIVECTQSLNSTLSVNRHEGYQDTLSEYDDIDTVTSIETDNTAEDTLTQVNNYLLQNPDIDAIVAHSVGIGNGVIGALKQQDMYYKRGEEGHIILSQIDGGPQANVRVSDGYIDYITDQPVQYYLPLTLFYAERVLQSGDEAIPDAGASVDDIDISGETPIEANIWAEDIWSPADIQQYQDINGLKWFRTDSVTINEENADAPYLWGNWIDNVA